jgi:hypothetical protein
MSTSSLAIPTSFPSFDLVRLLRTVFEPSKGEKTCVLIDLDDPAQVKDFSFLKNSSLTVQKYAHDIFYQGINNGAGKELGLTGGDLYAYKKTGGSNLDMDDLAVDTKGNHLKKISIRNMTSSFASRPTRQRLPSQPRPRNTVSAEPLSTASMILFSKPVSPSTTTRLASRRKSFVLA